MMPVAIMNNHFFAIYLRAKSQERPKALCVHAYSSFGATICATSLLLARRGSMSGHIRPMRGMKLGGGKIGQERLVYSDTDPCLHCVARSLLARWNRADGEHSSKTRSLMLEKGSVLREDTKSRDFIFVNRWRVVHWVHTWISIGTCN
jgi:hypothetical protein